MYVTNICICKIINKVIYYYKFEIKRGTKISMLRLFTFIFCFVFLFISCGTSNFDQAVIYQENAEYDKALEFYEKAISKKENVAQAEKNMGDIFFMQKDFNKAFECYKKSIESKPNLPMDHIFNLLSDSNKDIRTATKDMLVKIQNKTAREKIFEHLSKMLKSEQKFEKLDALEVVSSFGNSAKPVIDDVLALIDDENITIKQKVFEVLPSVAGIAIPAGSEEKLYGLLKHSNDMIKVGAIECIGKMKQITDYVPLIEIVKTKPAVKRTVLTAINNANPASRESAENIKKYLTDEDPRIKLLALAVLKRMGNNASSFVPKIIVLCADSNSAVSREAKNILTAIKITEQSIVPELIELLNNKNRNVKLEAIRWLANIGAGASASVEELKKLTKEEDKEVSASAILALKQIH